MELVSLFVGLTFVNNVVLSKFYAICPLLGVSKKPKNALNMGYAVTFVIFLASIITYLLYYYVLTPLNIIGEITLPISLTMRLFGNILSGSIISLLIYALLKRWMPIAIVGYIFTPFLHAYFDIFSGFIQTYIFFTLASFFLSEQVVEEV